MGRAFTRDRLDGRIRSGVFAVLHQVIRPQIGIGLGETWVEATKYTTIYSAIIKIAWALVVEQGYQTWTRMVAVCKLVGIEEEEAIETTESLYQLIRRIVDRFIGLEGGTRDPSLIDWIISKRTYKMAIWASMTAKVADNDLWGDAFGDINKGQVPQIEWANLLDNIAENKLPREVGELTMYYLWLVLPFWEKVQISVDPDFQGSPFVWGRPALKVKREREEAKVAKQLIQSEGMKKGLERAKQPVQPGERERRLEEAEQPVRRGDIEDDLEEVEQPVQSEEIETIDNEADDSAVRAVVRLVEQLKIKYPALAKIIVYSQEIKEAEKLSEALGTMLYYAKVDDQSGKDKRLSEWKSGNEESQVAVASNALSLRVDTGDTRAVVHARIPQDLANYVQKSGRAGRVGLPSEAIVLLPEESAKR
ncbi:hypothetical protein V502_01871 [Pseudogymnoascus sp. VKM F-4520 (FW-2644)]|nr:hypothetical protein V502_01871 [Pseudogymnoascus sp. VKM F-4520 (FW-2644)]